jgi:hypothetical protein
MLSRSEDEIAAHEHMLVIGSDLVRLKRPTAAALIPTLAKTAQGWSTLVGYGACEINILHG